MRFHQVAVVAGLAALSFTSSPVKAQTTGAPNLAVAAVHGQADWIFDITNTGSAASSSCTVQLLADGQTVSFPLFSLAPGEVFHVVAPEVTQFRPIWITCRLTPAVGALADS